MINNLLNKRLDRYYEIPENTDIVKAITALVKHACDSTYKNTITTKRLYFCPEDTYNDMLDSLLCFLKDNQPENNTINISITLDSLVDKEKILALIKKLKHVDIK